MKKHILIPLFLAALATAGTLYWLGKTQDNASVQGAVTQAEVYLDVRTAQEWEEGHLDNAMHFDLAKLQQGQLPTLPKNTPLSVYCRSGNRAGQAIEILRNNGFTNLRNAGAFTNLQAQGKKSCMGPEPICS